MKYGLMAIAAAFACQCLSGEVPRDVRVAACNAPAAQRAAADARPKALPSAVEADVVIYGGTSAGIAAAVAARRRGASCVVIEPSGRIGGLTTGGLGQTDIGNKSAFGGIAREFYTAVKRYYDDDTNWRFQRRDEYRATGQAARPQPGEENTMWTFEPKAAHRILRRYVTDDGCVRNEGNVEEGVKRGPYPIDFGAILPKRGECVNLLVPVCLSASHIAYGSIRMEPVFFSLGEVAGNAAAEAAKGGTAVQDVDWRICRVRGRGEVGGACSRSSAGRIGR